MRRPATGDTAINPMIKVVKIVAILIIPIFFRIQRAAYFPQLVTGFAIAEILRLTPSAPSLT